MGILGQRDLPEGMKVITSIWSCQKESNGTCRGQLNARGFEQVAGKHFDPTSTAAPVMNDTTIRIIYDVKGVFLKGKFEDGEEIFMEVPQGMEHHYWGLALLRLLKPIHGKQAALLLD